MHSTLITISGIDGSGKSTLISNLKWYLTKEGKISSDKIKTIWVKFGVPLIFLSFRNKKPIKINKLNNTNPFFLNIRNPFHFIKMIFFIIDHWLFFRLKLRYLLLNYDIVLCDRYIYDTYVDLMQNSNIPFHAVKRIIHFLRVPKPSKAYYLEIAPEKAFSRKKEVNLNYLQNRHELYRTITDNNLLIKLSADELSEDLSKKVCQEILTI